MAKAKTRSTSDGVGLFLDGSGRVGWALIGLSRHMPLRGCGTYQTMPQSSSEWGRRFLFTASWLDAMIVKHQPVLIGFEAPFLPPPPPKSEKARAKWKGFRVTGDTLRFLTGIAAVFEMVAAKHSIECREVNVQTVKASLAGAAKKIERDKTLSELLAMGATKEELKAAGLRLRKISKDDMVAAARARGWNVSDDGHQADACGVGKVIIENRLKGNT